MMNHHRSLCLLVLALGLMQPSDLVAGTPLSADMQKKIHSVTAFQSGQDYKPLRDIEALVLATAPDAPERADLEVQLLSALDQATSREARSFLCRQLRTIGTARSVPHLESLLADPESSHMARYALGRIEDPAAAKALEQALGTLGGEMRIGVVHTLGELHYAPAVPELVAMLTSSDAALVSAAVRSLGLIGSGEAIAALEAFRGQAAPGLQGVVDHAMLRAGEQALATGRVAEAKRLFLAAYESKGPVHQRAAGLRGWVTASGDQAAGLLVEALQDPDPKFRSRVIGMMTEAPGTQATRIFAERLASSSPEVQVQIVTMLAARGETVAAPEVLALCASPEETVRLAALEALGTLGQADTADALVRQAASVSGAERDQARQALERMSAEGVNDVLVQRITDPSAPVRAEAIRALAARGADEAAGRILEAAASPDQPGAVDALKALRELGGETQFPALVTLLSRANDPAWISEVERALAAIDARLPDPPGHTRLVIAVLPKTKHPEAKAAELRLLGKFGDPTGLPVLARALKAQEKAPRDAGVRALASWPDAAPSRALLAIAQSSEWSQTHRVLALRGYIEKITLHAEATDEQILGMFDTAMATAQRPEEKRLVLSKLADVRHPGALERARRYQSDPALKDAAVSAATRIEALLNRPGDVSASLNNDRAGSAIDGKPDTRWDTGSPMKGGEWYALDLGMNRTISGITLDCRKSDRDYPRGYEVFVSPNSMSRGVLVAKGEGKQAVTKIMFEKPVDGRRIMIVQTGQVDGLYWSIHELTVHTP